MKKGMWILIGVGAGCAALFFGFKLLGSALQNKFLSQENTDLRHENNNANRENNSLRQQNTTIAQENKELKNQVAKIPDQPNSKQDKA